ncbi:MAG: hypothetical protein WCQ95_00165 [Bacteroidota bacterium]
MKHLLTLLFIGMQLSAFCQTQTTQTIPKDKTTDSTTFVTTFNLAHATKDGYYINGYVVEIDWNQAKKLDGKKIRITGKVSIVKGQNSEPRAFDADGNPMVDQGRTSDTRHIVNPKIELIAD